MYQEKERKIIEEANPLCPDQNTINLSNKNLSHAGQPLLRKSPSFIPTPAYIYWSSLRQNFDSFVNKLRYRVSKPAETSSINVDHMTNTVFTQKSASLELASPFWREIFNERLPQMSPSLLSKEVLF